MRIIRKVTVATGGLTFLFFTLFFVYNLSRVFEYIQVKITGPVNPKITPRNLDLDLKSSTKPTANLYKAIVDRVQGNDNQNARKVLKRLENRVQLSLNRLQNPRDCTNARKYVCRIYPTCGLGCTLHHIGPCFIKAIGMNRTVIVELMNFEYKTPHGLQDVYRPFSKTCTTVGKGEVLVDIKDKKLTSSALNLIHHVRGNYLAFTQWTPLTVPDVVLQELWGIHEKPDIWWLGQLHSYISRLTPASLQDLEKIKKEINFSHPIVGVQIRRTDKLISEAKSYELAQYMDHVEKFFDVYELKTKPTKVLRKVFLSTDEPAVYEEALKKYPNYHILASTKHINFAGKQRKTTDGLLGIAYDIELLSLCDFLVCTFTSNVGRLAYELMTAKTRGKVEAVSLDYIYHYGEFLPYKVAVPKPASDTMESRDGVAIENKSNDGSDEEFRQCPWPVRYEGLDWTDRSHDLSRVDVANQSATCLRWFLSLNNGLS